MHLTTAHAAAAKAELARRHLVDFARYIEVPGAPAGETVDDDGEIVPAPSPLAEHHILILEAAQRCIDTPGGRMMLFMPPGSAKSTYGSIVVPAWVMGAKPNFRMISVSYGSDLARKMGRRTRSIVKQAAYKRVFNTAISAESAAADEWALDNGSEYMAGGILSGITGNRADLIVIDDPIKGRQEADSEVTRQRTIDAYQDDVLTRLKPGGSVFIIQTRWHMADLAGSLLPEDYAGESGVIRCRDGQDWEVICLAAQAERSDDPLGREVGEFIWPEWFPPGHWAQFKRLPRTWNALFQQRPAPDSGDYFKREWIIPVSVVPPVAEMMIYGGSDYAVSEGKGDFTVHVVVGVASDGRMYLLDLWRAQTASDKWVDSFCALVRKWNPVGWAEETGQIKGGVGPFLLKQMVETESYVFREQFGTHLGNKAIRAQSIRGRMAMQGLHVPAGAPWLSDFISELMSFPVGVHDDQVDALGLVGQLMDRMSNGNVAKVQDTRYRPAGALGAVRAPAIFEGRRR